MRRLASRLLDKREIIFGGFDDELEVALSVIQEYLPKSSPCCLCVASINPEGPSTVAAANRRETSRSDERVWMFVVFEANPAFPYHTQPPTTDVFLRGKPEPEVTLKWLLEHGVSDMNDPRELVWAAVPWEGVSILFSEKGYLKPDASLPCATSLSHFKPYPLD